MKTAMEKLLALALAATLALSLAACGPKESGDVPTPAPSPSATQEVRTEVDFLPDNAIDMAQEVLGFPNTTVLLTVNGKGVTAEEYLYWLGNMTAYYEMMTMYSGQTLNFDEAIGEDGTTWDKQLKEIAYQNTLLLAVTPEAAAQRGISLADADVAKLIEQRESNIESAGGEEMYAYQLQAMGINDRTAFELDKVSTLFGKVQEAMEAEVTDADVAAYIRENDLLRCKHILFKTVDDDRQPLDEATIAQKRAQAEETMAQLREDPTRFDELMNDRSEDTGLQSAPDGYLFGPGEMVAVFEDTTKSLEVGAISDIVESEYGYHIILRLDADCAQSREEAASQAFERVMNEYVENAKVEKKTEYDSFTTKEYYEGLTQLQDSLERPTQVEDMSDATLEPAQTAQPTETPEPAGD